MAEATKAAVEPRSVDAGRGISWWTDAWALFTKSAGMWIVLALIMIVIFIALSFIPFLGSLAVSLLAPAFFGSWLLAARKVESGGALEVGDLFSAFRDRLTPLLVVGALLLVASLVIAFVVGALGFGAVIGAVSGGASGSGGAVMAAIGAGMLAVLVALVLGFVVAMAFWFAPALIVFHNVAPVDALKGSFSASLKNMVPFLLYSILYLIAAFVASIPLGLGWIVLLPVLMLTAYAAYKDVFGG